MQIVVSWCMMQTLITSGNPGDLLLDKTLSTNDDINYQMALTYG